MLHYVQEGRETEKKTKTHSEWVILNNFYNEVGDPQQQKHLAS